MTKTRLALFFILVGTLGACGGRSALKNPSNDAGNDADMGASPDGKSDTYRIVPDVPPPADVPPPDVADALSPDVLAADYPDVARLDGPADGVKNDVPADGVRNDGVADGPRDGIPIPIDMRSDGGVDAIPTLVSLGVTPPSATIVVGVGYNALVVTAVYSDGSSVDVTSQSTYTSGDVTIVQVSGHTLTGVKAGSTPVKVAYSGLTAVVNVTVSASPLQSISIDGTTTVSVGQYILVTATGIYGDGSKQDLTAQATWTSAAAATATVSADSATAKERITGVAAGTVSVTAVYQGITGKASITVTAAAMTAITVTPVQPILQKGVSQAFQATATYADGSTADVTLQASWTSDNATVASVTSSATGVVVKALSAGSANISATVGSITGSTQVVVTTPTLVSIAVTPATWSPNVGGTQAFTATGAYSDNSTADVTISATWSSTNTTAVAVSNAAGQQGTATALAVGTAQVQAALSGVTGSASVTVSSSPMVSIAITQGPAVSLVLGLSSPLTATATYQNGTKQDVTTQVAWTTADTTIATVSNAAATAGQITGVGVGTTTVYATLAGFADKAVVTVSQATLKSIAVMPATATVSAGNTQQFTALGTYDNGATPDLTTQVTWSSSNTGIAQVSNAAGSKGLATSLVAGTATITATLGSVSGTAALTVGAPLLSSILIAPTTANIVVGTTQAFTVTGVYQNGTTGAVAGTWSSSDTGVATLVAGVGGRRAVATGVTAGSTTITVTYQGMTDSATLTVAAARTVVGLTITPSNPATILVGATQQFQANVVYSDGTTTAVTNTANWTSSDATIASVSNGGAGPFGGGRGLATGVGAGTATITATYQGQTATVNLSVRNPALTGLLVTPTTASIRVNGTQQFVALATFEDGTSQTVTNSASWTTSSSTIASITSGGGGPFGGGRGLATGLTAGTVTITATYSGFTDTASLTVTAATPTSLVVTPATASVQVDQTRAFVATLVYDDGTTSNVTGTATWSSSDPTVATITTAGGGGFGGGGGTATALATGVSTITASYSGLSGTATLTVTDPPLSYVQVTPTNPSIPVGATQQFTATAVFTDNSTRNVTATATWTSSKSTVAVVMNNGGTIGRASALAEGTATITATYGGMSGTSQLSVAGSVQSITVTPVNPTTVIGVSVAFTATAILSNNATFPVTALASWTSSDPTVATVTAAGDATPVKAGPTTVTATYLGQAGTSVLTVSAATLSTITITPSSPSLSLANGDGQQLTATGTYSDSSKVDLTNAATWFSSDPTVAMVSNAAGSRGLATALKAGPTKVTAVFQGVTSTADTVTVTP
jgi:uncharacterized protein YjdB